MRSSVFSEYRLQVCAWFGSSCVLFFDRGLGSPEQSGSMFVACGFSPSVSHVGSGGKSWAVTD
ncbi:hypothetical protein E2C01_007220 [Portunus trituberculatus]|uniref:Uncharacterized protein n=1 Tax=Portunus trituberculatus TaxID=210409 RepID=A0A5B7D3T1_PORTR|nr:hypothetical protein [Portunus trituberculatus]